MVIRRKLIHINNDVPQLAPSCKNVRKNRCPVTNRVQMLNVIFKKPLVSRVTLLGCRLRPIYYGLVVIYVRKRSCWIPFTTPRTWTKIWMVRHCWRWLQRPLSQNFAVLYICWYGLGSRKTIVFKKPRMAVHVSIGSSSGLSNIFGHLPKYLSVSGLPITSISPSR
jgi:hypothetical protein